MEIRFAAHPEDVKHYTTERLRQDFLMENLMKADQVELVYSHYDRFITGGAMPVQKEITLPTPGELKASYFLERREMGIINAGGKGSIVVDGQKYEMNNKDILYIGRGSKEVSFKSESAALPSKFFITSCPAHTSYPTTKAELSKAEPVELGNQETCNQRTIYKLIHANGIKSCQLVMGMTMFKPGSIWNTMPCHVHTRRMEVYYYFDMPENARVVHLMGQPSETRHLVVANDQAILSPPWSIHSGAGTASYSFLWVMAGENIDFTDMDFVDMKDFK